LNYFAHLLFGELLATAFCCLKLAHEKRAKLMSCCCKTGLHIKLDAVRLMSTSVREKQSIKIYPVVDTERTVGKYYIAVANIMESAYVDCVPIDWET
jgi:hypothetical protein